MQVTLSEHEEQFSVAYAWYVAALLALANAVAFIDRTILSLLIEPIKADLGVGDTAMGLLHGFAFAIFYSLLGVPIARAADHSSRRSIILAGVVVWSAMTAACGLVKSFFGLFVARVGVGAGEAGLTPPAYSLLADYFPPERLAAAMGLFASGIYVGGGVALIVGGPLLEMLSANGPLLIPFVGETQPWRLAFFIVALPGLIVAALFTFVREPERRNARTTRASPIEVAGWLRAHKGAYLSLTLGFSLMIMLGYGTSAWWPAFFLRTHGWSFGEIGTYYGGIVLICGTGGALIGGMLAQWLRRRGYMDANLRAALIGSFALLPTTIIAPLMPTGAGALAVLATINFCAGLPFGGGYAALQEVTPGAMRAQVSALFLLVVNLVGVGLGPVLIGVLTDFVFRDEALLHYALALAAVLISPLAILVLWRGLAPYRRILMERSLAA